MTKLCIWSSFESNVLKLCYVFVVEWNYKFSFAKEVVEGSPRNLLESVAELIASKTLESFPCVSAVRVKLWKPNVPRIQTDIDYFGIEILRNRATWITLKAIICILSCIHGNFFLFISKWLWSISITKLKRVGNQFYIYGVIWWTKSKHEDFFCKMFKCCSDAINFESCCSFEEIEKERTREVAEIRSHRYRYNRLLLWAKTSTVPSFYFCRWKVPSLLFLCNYQR